VLNIGGVLIPCAPFDHLCALALSVSQACNISRKGAKHYQSRKEKPETKTLREYLSLRACSLAQQAHLRIEKPFT
jgi:hypothetical protein